MRSRWGSRTLTSEARTTGEMIFTPTPGMLAASALLVLTLGCGPELVVGELTCEGAGGIGAVDDDTFNTEPLAVPWSSSFEYGACEWSSASRFCYADETGSFESVSSPVHSGRHAFAFSVDTSAGVADPGQARCVVEGGLPEAAVYGAWYFVPEAATNAGNWNLLHFEGGSPSDRHALWDVSLASSADGGLVLDLYDFERPQVHLPEDAPRVPIGEWFHVELFLLRASDDTGEVALYQDGELILELTDLSTADSDWGQWYVGNLANALEPSKSTLYVDDISITLRR